MTKYIVCTSISFNIRNIRNCLITPFSVIKANYSAKAIHISLLVILTFWEQTPHLFLYHGAPASNEVCSAPISLFPLRNCGTFALNYTGGISLCCSLKITLSQHCINRSLCGSGKLALKPSVRQYIEGYRANE